MKLLLILTLVVVGPALLAGLAARVNPRFSLRWDIPARIGVSLLFVGSGIAHFTGTQNLVRMLPAFVPARAEIIYITGVFELAGALGIWIPRLEQITGACLVALIIAVFPANVYAALNHMPIAGHESGIWYLLMRVPFQILLVLWVYRATRQTWVARFLRRDD